MSAGIFLSLAFATYALATNPIIQVPASLPSNAAPVVPKTFPGFAFEQASWWDYSTNAQGTTNRFSRNLINEIATRTGATPILRVGGTSGDHSFYNVSQTIPVNPPASLATPPVYGGVTLGPTYWDSFTRFENVQYIFMVPMAKSNLTNAVAWAEAGLASIGSQLYSIEIGNEANFYLNETAYVPEFLKYEAAISGISTVPAGPIYQAFDVASGSANSYVVGDVFNNLGIDTNGLIKSVAYHFYQTTSAAGSDLQTGLMSHSAIVNRLAAFQPYITYLKNNHPSIPFILSEVGNSLTDGAPNYSFQNVFGSALWAVDFQLYCMAIGVAGVNMQQILHAGFQMWEPVVSAGESQLVRPAYYSQPFVADFISTTSNTRVITLNSTASTGTAGSVSSDVSAYAAYNNGNLARAAIVNLNLWSSSDNTTRPSQTFSLSLPSTVKSVSVEYLTSPDGGTAVDTITWAGNQWTYASGGNASRVLHDTVNLTVSGSSVSVSVNASSAVMLFFS